MTDFRFSTLCGVVFSGGNLLFTQQDSSTSLDSREEILLSPVGNKITAFDLTNNVAQTFPFQNRSNIQIMALSPDGQALITIDGDGFGLIINFQKKVVIAHFNFRGSPTALSFSPDSKFFIVVCGKKLKVFETPSVTHKVFSPLVLYKKYGNLHSEDITGVSWSSCSRFFLTWSTDLTMKMMSLHKIDGFLPFTFSGNKKRIIRAFFSQDNQRIVSISKNGRLCIWKWTGEKSDAAQKMIEFQQFSKGKRLKLGDKDVYVPTQADFNHYTEFEMEVTKGRFVLEKVTKFTLQKGASIVSCDFNHGNSNQKILVVGQSNGVFSIFNMDTLESISTFQISESRIDSVAVNPSGEWVALASKEEGQLFVWEWRSETYILKQQGHSYDLSAVGYSPDGTYLATGGEDGKVKLWAVKNGLCFCTFTDHTASVTDLKFIVKNQHGGGNSVVVSSSLDGTVRAYDLLKYRNFRVLTPVDKNAQISCLAVTSGGGLGSVGDIVCGGSAQTFDIYVWNLKNGQLLDVLNGHTGPISSLAFNSTGSLLASGSWDNTGRVWDIFNSKSSSVETLNHSSEVLSVAFLQNDKEVITSTLSGQIQMWEAESGNLIGVVECKDDIAGGRLRGDRVTAQNSTKNKHFNAISVSPNAGGFVIGGGNSKHVCLYDLRHRLMIRRFAITQNRSLDGVMHILNSKHMKGEAGVADHELELDSDMEDEDLWHQRNQADQQLPGAKQLNKAALQKRNTKLAIRVKTLTFSPDGSQFAVASTEGLLLYSLASLFGQGVFNPFFETNENITVDQLIESIQEEDFMRALLIALKLNEEAIIEKVYKCIPAHNIALISANIPSNYLFRFLQFLSNQLSPITEAKTSQVSNLISLGNSKRDLEWNMLWLKNLIRFNQSILLNSKGQSKALLLKLGQSIQFYEQNLKKMTNENTQMMKFIIKRHEQKKEQDTSRQVTAETI